MDLLLILKIDSTDYDRLTKRLHMNHGAKTQAVLMTVFRSAELQEDNPIETVLAMARSAITANTTYG